MLSSTLSWCNTKLAEITDENPYQLIKYDIFLNGDLIHALAYLKLRTTVAYHIEIGAEPVFFESVHPIAGQNWIPTITAEQDTANNHNEGEIDDNTRINFFEDRPDEAVIDKDLEQDLDL